MVRLYNLGAQSLWLDEGGTWAEITSRGWPALLPPTYGTAEGRLPVLPSAAQSLRGGSSWRLRVGVPSPRR